MSKDRGFSTQKLLTIILFLFLLYHLPNHGLKVDGEDGALSIVIIKEVIYQITGRQKENRSDF